MAFIVLYRKPKYQTAYPWQDSFQTANDAYAFICKLGVDYDCRVFAEMDLTDLEEIMDEYREASGLEPIEASPNPPKKGS